MRADAVGLIHKRTKKTKKEIEEELKEIKRILEEKLNRRDDNK